jgi:hypothetical protein
MRIGELRNQDTSVRALAKKIGSDINSRRRRERGRELTAEEIFARSTLEVSRV